MAAGPLISDSMHCDDVTRAVLLALETCDVPDAGVGDMALRRQLLDSYPDVPEWRLSASLTLLIELGYVERSPEDRYAFRVRRVTAQHADAAQAASAARLTDSPVPFRSMPERGAAGSALAPAGAAAPCGA